MSDKYNCPNCGAPITGEKCEYCGTIFKKQSKHTGNTCTFYADGIAYMTVDQEDPLVINNRRIQERLEDMAAKESAIEQYTRAVNAFGCNASDLEYTFRKFQPFSDDPPYKNSKKEVKTNELLNDQVSGHCERSGSKSKSLRFRMQESLSRLFQRRNVGL